MKKLLFLTSIFLIQVCKPAISYSPPKRWSTEQVMQILPRVWKKDEKIKSIFKAACGTESIEEIMNSSNYPVEAKYKQTCPLVKKFLEITIDQLREHLENQEKKQNNIDRLQQELIVAQNDFFQCLNQRIQQIHEISTTNNTDELADTLAAFVQTLQDPQEVTQPEDRYNTTDGTH